MTTLEEIQSKIDKWKELTSNLESIKEKMFEETSSTQFNNLRNGSPRREIEGSPMSNYNHSTPSSNTDRMNPLESHIEGEYVIDLTTKMKSPEKVDEFPDSHFTPIKEDDESESSKLSNAYPRNPRNPQSQAPQFEQNEYEEDLEYEQSEEEFSSFPSSFCIDEFDKTNSKIDKAIGQLRDVLHSIDL